MGDGRTCRECGCTNFATCPGGCWWVEDDLCSSCGIAVDAATGSVLAEADLPPLQFAGDPDPDAVRRILRGDWR